MFEKPRKAQVVRIKIEAVSLDSRSMAPSLDGLLLAQKQPVAGAAKFDPRVYVRIFYLLPVDAMPHNPAAR
jgi:hypothetical protein